MFSSLGAVAFVAFFVGYKLYNQGQPEDDDEEDTFDGNEERQPQFYNTDDAPLNVKPPSALSYNTDDHIYSSVGTFNSTNMPQYALAGQASHMYEIPCNEAAYDAAGHNQDKRPEIMYNTAGSNDSLELYDAATINHAEPILYDNEMESTECVIINDRFSSITSVENPMYDTSTS